MRPTDHLPTTYQPPTDHLPTYLGQAPAIPVFKLAPHSGTGLLQLFRARPSFCVNNLSSIDRFYTM